MNKFAVMLGALCLAFLSGWLFSNEVPAPRFDNVALAMWIATGLVALISAMMVSASN